MWEGDAQYIQASFITVHQKAPSLTPHSCLVGVTNAQPIVSFRVTLYLPPVNHLERPGDLFAPVKQLPIPRSRVTPAPRPSRAPSRKGCVVNGQWNMASKK